jgi:hypothetical protein
MGMFLQHLITPLLNISFNIRVSIFPPRGEKDFEELVLGRTKRVCGSGFWLPSRECLSRSAGGKGWVVSGFTGSWSFGYSFVLQLQPNDGKAK